MYNLKDNFLLREKQERNVLKCIFLQFCEYIYNEYYLIEVSLCHRVLEAFTLVLNLPYNCFKSMCQKRMLIKCLLHYSLQPIIIDEDQLECGTHID